MTAEDYRQQITGWLPTDDGKVPTYVVPFNDLDGHLVTYEGRTLRGPDGEKTEVMLTSIFHVDHLAADPMSDLSALTTADLLSIASWQIDALPEAPASNGTATPPPAQQQCGTCWPSTPSPRST